MPGSILSASQVLPHLIMPTRWGSHYYSPTRKRVSIEVLGYLVGILHFPCPESLEFLLLVSEWLCCLPSCLGLTYRSYPWFIPIFIFQITHQENLYYLQNTFSATSSHSFFQHKKSSPLQSSDWTIPSSPCLCFYFTKVCSSYSNCGFQM